MYDAKKDLERIYKKYKAKIIAVEKARDDEIGLLIKRLEKRQLAKARESLKS